MNKKRFGGAPHHSKSAPLIREMSDGIQFIQIDFQKKYKKNTQTKNTKGKENLLQDPFVHRSFCDAPLRVLDLIGHVAAAEPGRGARRGPSSSWTHHGRRRRGRIASLACSRCWLARSLAAAAAGWWLLLHRSIGPARAATARARGANQRARTHARADP